MAAIVEGCTDSEVTPKPPWEERKQQYAAHLSKETNKSVLLVSAADKLANVRAILKDYRDIGETVWNRFNAPRDRVLWYYRSLANIFLAKMESPLARDLDRAMADLEATAVR